jgi:hypothetical protein
MIEYYIELLSKIRNNKLKSWEIIMNFETEKLFL